MSEFLHQAIYDLNSNVVGISGDPIKCIDKDKNDITSTVNMTEAQAKAKELSDAYNAIEYQRKRVDAYPNIGDQLDKIYHEGIDEWKKVIKAVKDKYPKPQ